MQIESNVDIRFLRQVKARARQGINAARRKRKYQERKGFSSVELAALQALMEIEVMIETQMEIEQ